MRCVADDKPLTSREMGLKSSVTGEHWYLCTPCLIAAGLLVPEATPAPQEPDEPIVPEDDYFTISGLKEEDFIGG